LDCGKNTAHGVTPMAVISTGLKMNKRIRELVEKSYIYDRQNDSSIFDKEKFAELIVRECIAEIESVKVDEYGTDVYDIGYDDGLTQSVETIKEHFGVEL